MPERVSHSEEQLRSASAHLYYEVMMFDATARALMTGAFGESVTTNAFLESFTIHTRALLHFFHPSGAKDTDVLAEHFFDDRMVWLRTRGGIPKPLSDVDYRVGKEIAHLTYDRLDVEPEAKLWEIQTIRKAMMHLVDTFAQHAPERNLAPSWAVAYPRPTYHPEGAGALPSSATNHVTMVNTPSANAFVGAPDPEKEHQ